MAKQSTLLLYVLITFCAFHASQILGHTDELDIMGLQKFYKCIDQPPQLSMWQSKGGDPCHDHWIGVECEGSAVISLKLHGLKLSGNLGNGLFWLKNLTRLDLSSNNFVSRIPYYLPPKVTSLNLADNRLSSSIPRTFASMKDLRRLDLSYNSFSGDLPNSFAATNLCRLSIPSVTKFFLSGFTYWNNQFTGILIYLEDLTLIDLIGGNEGLSFAEFVALREEIESEMSTGDFLQFFCVGYTVLVLIALLEVLRQAFRPNESELRTIKYVLCFCLISSFVIALIEVCVLVFWA
ncbi:hypothetical protein Leryth_006325 [Lithospermum erythrorhizon]|nr:hypothetical protein Leryth_006325 [Lithospermum erythrorhizon]